MKRIILLSILLSACGEQPANFIKIAGGGLQFNLATSEANMVVVAQQMTPPPVGSSLEALFDIPGTNTRQTISIPITNDRLQYKLESKPLTGITKGGRYNVSLILHDHDGKILDRKDTVYTSDQDQSTLPNKPLAEGPALIPHLENLAPVKP